MNILFFLLLFLNLDSWEINKWIHVTISKDRVQQVRHLGPSPADHGFTIHSQSRCRTCFFWNTKFHGKPTEFRMVRKHLSLKQGLKLKKSLKISFWRYHDHGAVLKFVDYSVRGTMLLVQMDIHIAVACTDGRNRPKNITNWRVWTCDGPVQYLRLQ